MPKFATFSYAGPGPVFDTKAEAHSAIKADSRVALNHWHWRNQRDAALLANIEPPAEPPRALGLIRVSEVPDSD